MTDAGLLYATTAILWGMYSSVRTHNLYGSEGRQMLSFVINVLVCPVAIMVTIYQETHDS